MGKPVWIKGNMRFATQSEATDFAKEIYDPPERVKVVDSGDDPVTHTCKDGAIDPVTK